jgi:hypothetical protein
VSGTFIEYPDEDEPLRNRQLLLIKHIYASAFASKEIELHFHTLKEPFRKV